MSPQAMAVLQELAETGGFKDEFDEVKDKPKCYFKDDCYKVIVVKSEEEFDALEGNDLRVFYIADEVELFGRNLDKVKKIRFKEGAEVDLSCAENLPKELDFSMCSKVDLSRCDLTGVEKIKFKDKEQEKEFMKSAENFIGKVEYVGDDEKGKVMPMNNNGMEM